MSSGKKTLFTILIVFCFCLIIATCQSKPKGVVVTGIQVIAPTQKYIFKTSTPGFTTITGSLVVLDPTKTLPAPDDAIYLVEIDQSQGGAFMPQIEKGKSLQAEVYEVTGEFTFINVKQGTYIVMVRTMAGSDITIHFFRKSDLATVTVKDTDKDKVIAIGELSLP